jgi:hypothetical protein
MSAQQVEVAAAPQHKKVLVRMLPGKQGKRWGYRGVIMKAGIYHKASQEVSRLLLQRRYKDGTPRFEVDSLRSALTKLKAENPQSDPRLVLTASPLPEGVSELEDMRAAAQAAYRGRRAVSFEALLREARSGDLLLEAEDEEFLQGMVEDGQPIKSAGESQMDSRMAAMERHIAMLTHALEVSRTTAAGGREQLAKPGKDPYDVKIYPPDPEPAPELTEEEIRAAEDDMFVDELPEKIDLEQSLAQAEAAEEEEAQDQVEAAELDPKPEPPKPAAKKRARKKGRSRQAIPRLGGGKGSR